MVDFKVCISDPASGKTYQKEVKDAEAQPFMGLNIGEKVKGEVFGMTGYEFQITGGSDNCGFPMRRGILGVRKKLNLLGGVGLRKTLDEGTKKRKTVCGQKINEKITQINLKPLKTGTKKLEEIFAAPQEKAEENASS